MFRTDEYEKHVLTPLQVVPHYLAIILPYSWQGAMGQHIQKTTNYDIRLKVHGTNKSSFFLVFTSFLKYLKRISSLRAIFICIGRMPSMTLNGNLPPPPKLIGFFHKNISNVQLLPFNFHHLIFLPIFYAY